MPPHCCHGTCGAIPLHKRSEPPMATSPTAKHKGQGIADHVTKGAVE